MNNTDNYPNRPDRQFWHMLGAVGLFIAALVIACILQGCNPTKRITRIAINHPGSLARPCADFYPPTKLTDKTNTVYLPGKEIAGPTRFVTVDCDSATAAISQTGTVHRVLVNAPCPPSTKQVDTINTERTITIENTARIEVLTKERDDYKVDATKFKKRANLWMWIGIGGIVALVAGFVLRIKNIV